LEWLDRNSPQGKTLIDYGCGSGILAIAAAKLNASSIVATDIDEQALIATRENMRRNAIVDNTISTCFPEELAATPADIVMANILSGPLIELADTLLNLVKPSGQIVLSGLLENQTDNIIASYSSQLENVQVKQQGDWIRISGQKLAI
jgi:ribosomal protein L11 methyltransferase